MNVLLLLVSLAAAAEPALRVEVDEAAAARLDVATVVGALGEELDVHVILEGEAPARVSVRADGPDAVAIVYERDDGTRRERVVQLPGERGESTRIVVLLVSNLARDQVGAVPPVDVVEAAPAEAEALRVPRAPADRKFHLGAGVVAGAATVEDRTTAFYLWGVEVGGRLGDHVGVGMAHLSVNGGFGSGGATVLFAGTPYLEVAGFVAPRVQPYSRVGLLVQTQTSSRAQSWFEAAPYLGGGARVFVTPSLAVGLEVGAHLVVTEELTLGNARLSRWSLPGTVGLSTTFNF
ncbi:MAG: hypothetical protein V4850_31890 [Myxococcota bacterium]